MKPYKTTITISGATRREDKYSVRYFDTAHLAEKYLLQSKKKGADIILEMRVNNRKGRSAWKPIKVTS